MNNMLLIVELFLNLWNRFSLISLTFRCHWSWSESPHRHRHLEAVWFRKDFASPCRMLAVWGADSWQCAVDVRCSVNLGNHLLSLWPYTAAKVDWMFITSWLDQNYFLEHIWWLTFFHQNYGMSVFLKKNTIKLLQTNVMLPFRTLGVCQLVSSTLTTSWGGRENLSRKLDEYLNRLNVRPLSFALESIIEKLASTLIVNTNQSGDLWLIFWTK